MTDARALVWFRRDLRVHDNEALSKAATADSLLSVYCVDPREYGPREYGGADSFRFEKTGPHRTRFRLDSLSDLRESLRERGSDLLVRRGRPETVLPDLAETLGVDTVYFHTWPTPEEMTVEAAVKSALRAADVDLRRFWGHSLYHVNDLPTSYREIPDTYTPFRKSVESDASVRPTFETPSSLPPLPDAVSESEAGTLPTPSELGVDGPPDDERAVLDFEGGETAGLQRLDEYVWERDCLREYKETRNGMVGADYSSKFSAWLNEGCLSPRRVHEEVKRYEDERISNDSTYWLLFELLWRDFFQFQLAKHGGQFFTREGIRERDDIEWRDDETQFERWAEGETGIPFVDANMRELNRSGYMSNRGRQNAASFLVNNLRLDWRRGAAYFETQLVDYDPCSNYGNWAYIAGVGNDSRDRYFNIVKQAKQYDGDAEYIKRWLPELESLPPAKAHEPWTLSADEQREFGVELGVDYPQPMVELEASYEKLR
ncbi:cryptochrome DASH [Haloprofundus marisrubri]|uniref:Cryptochrome DASH n=1 Tax=Haloprofundus marisrubri TaxID=1514971 RepID=A0A0W1R5U1_9EURY|nr:DASH family cryptochrome [Haloprofundus marisrubri]KTG08572.1 cryptochrome DASH [Haloprofundus marisrubri]